MFELVWETNASKQYGDLKIKAEKANANRSHKSKKSAVEGLFGQVHKTLNFLKNNPKHPGLNCHEYDALENPIDPDAKVFEAYAQNKTPGAYRVFWCYGPATGQITIIAITPHP